MILPNLSQPIEGIKFRSEHVEAYISQRSIGTGTLHIAESHLNWNKDNSEEALSLEYPHIAIHAISRDAQSFQHPCLYLMLDICLEEGDGTNGHDNGSGDDEDEGTSDMTEVRFVPTDPLLLEFMYKALNECQILHPDPDQQSDDGIGEEENFGEHADPIDEENEPIQEQDPENLPSNGHGGEGEEDDDMETGQFEDATS